MISRVIDGALDWSFLSEEIDSSDDDQSNRKGEDALDWRKGAMLEVKEKLNEIKVGPLDFQDSTLGEVFGSLFHQVRARDSRPPARSGVGFILSKPRVVDEEDALGGGRAQEDRLTMKVGKTGLCDALDLICEASAYRWEIDPEVLKVVIQPKATRMETGSNLPEADPNDPFSGAR